MNIFEDIHEYSFRISSVGINIQINIKYIKKWRLNTWKNIQKSNEYLFKYLKTFQMVLNIMNIHVNIYLNIQHDFKWCKISWGLNIYECLEYLHKYSEGHIPRWKNATFKIDIDYVVCACKSDKSVCCRMTWLKMQDDPCDAVPAAASV